MRTAARRSPARVSSSGSCSPSTGSPGGKPSSCGELVDAEFFAAIAVTTARRRPTGAQVFRIDARHALHRGHRDRERASPSLTRIAWVTASVNGRRSMKVVPLPCSDSIDSEPPSCLISLCNDVHADAASGQLGDLLAVEKPVWVINEAAGCRSGLTSRLATDRVRCRLADRFAIHAATVVADAHAPLRWPRGHRDVDRAFGRLAAARRSAGVSMPCAIALRSMCSNGAFMRSSRLRSISPCAPSTFELRALADCSRAPGATCGAGSAPANRTAPCACA